MLPAKHQYADDKTQTHAGGHDSYLKIAFNPKVSYFLSFGKAFAQINTIAHRVKAK